MFRSRRRQAWAGARVLAGLLILCGPSHARGNQDKTDYATLADDFVRSHLSDEQMESRSPSSIPLEEFLERAYVHVDVGVFRIHYPKRGFVDMAGRKKKLLTYRGKPNADNAARELSAIGIVLLDVQQHWAELVGSAGSARAKQDGLRGLERGGDDAPLPGYAELREWIEIGWQAKAAQKAVKGALTDEKRAWHKRSSSDDGRPHAALDWMEQITGENASVRAASSAFGHAMRAGTYWDGVTVHERDPLAIVLCPTRGDLVGFALYSARAREVPDDSWHPGIWQYTQFHLNGVQAIGFRYAEEGNAQDLFGGKYMSDIDQEDGTVLQHAVQYGATLLLEYYFGPTYVSNDPATPDELRQSQRVMGALFAGTRKFLVTYMFGKNEVRDEGDVANRTNARSQFIAGGNSSGGTLGKLGAEISRWRKRASKGSNFLVDLRDNVEFTAEKGGPGITARLELKTEGSKRGKGHVVASPFLARDAQQILPPAAGPAGEKERDREKRLRLQAGFGQDYVGFLRAYEIAFYRWLVSDLEPAQGSVSGKSAREAHATLFRELATVVAEWQKPDAPTYDLSAQMHETIERVYGVPLSWSEDRAGDSLEGQFLRWVAATADR